MSTSFNPPNMSQFMKYALMVGVVLILAMLVPWNHDQFFEAYLIGWTFWTGIAIGSLALLMLQHLTGGGWGFVIRRILEASTRTLPVMAVLFIPILLGAHSLYHHWMDPEEVKKHAVVGLKTPYLNFPFFTIRAVVYFAILLAIVYFLNRWSLLQDRTGDNLYTRKMRTLSGPGMVLLVFTVTFASVDWYMSIEPEWFSTIYGFLFVAAWSLSALAFTIAALAVLSKGEPLKRIVAPLHFHDLGKLLLALVMLWAYFAFSQYLIIWSGNLPEEIVWYLRRIPGLWGATIIAIGILHFAAPFLFLLSRSVKRNPRTLMTIAIVIIVMRMVDLIWMIAPGFGGHNWVWLDAIALLGFAGLWLAVFSWQLGKRSLIPINDPQYESVLEQHHMGH